MLFSCLAIFTKVSRIVQFSHQRVFSKFEIYWFAFVRYVFFLLSYVGWWIRCALEWVLLGERMQHSRFCVFTTTTGLCWGLSRKTRSAGTALRPLHHRGAHNVHGNISMRIAEFVWNNCIDCLQLGLSCRPDSWSPFTKAASNYARILIAKGIT